MHTIYCFNNGGSPGWYEAVAIGDDGVVVAGHICSDEYYMEHDLGITSNWKHEKYDAHFGKGNWKLEWVSDPLNHEGCKAAFDKNVELAKAGKPTVIEENMPSVTVELSKD